VCELGVNAPERLNKNDVRRWCLGCTAATGHFVERTCPAAEKKRAVQSEKAAAKRNALKDREREAFIAKHMLGDLDLVAETRRLWNLPVMKEQRRWSPRTPDVEFRRSATKPYSSGHAWSGGRAVVTMGSDPFGVREVLLHELVHVALPSTVHHGDPFFPVLVRAAREAWPHVDFPMGEVHKLRRAWDKDEWIRTHLKRAES
jgi:hypothetical protein